MCRRPGTPLDQSQWRQNVPKSSKYRVFNFVVYMSSGLETLTVYACMICLYNDLIDYRLDIQSLYKLLGIFVASRSNT